METHCSTMRFSNVFFRFLTRRMFYPHCYVAFSRMLYANFISCSVSTVHKQFPFHLNLCVALEAQAYRRNTDGTSVGYKRWKKRASVVNEISLSWENLVRKALHWKLKRKGFSLKAFCLKIDLTSFELSCAEFFSED